MKWKASDKYLHIRTILDTFNICLSDILIRYVSRENVTGATLK